MKYFYLTGLIAIGLLLILGSGIARATDDAYMADKYNEALQKGCPPVIVKHTVVAGVLGLFFGGGLFYTEHYGGAIRDAVLFPISWMWDPILAVKAARDQNRQATVAACRASESRMSKK